MKAVCSPLLLTSHCTHLASSIALIFSFSANIAPDWYFGIVLGAGAGFSLGARALLHVQPLLGVARAARGGQCGERARALPPCPKTALSAAGGVPLVL